MQRVILFTGLGLDNTDLSTLLFLFIVQLYTVHRLKLVVAVKTSQLLQVRITTKIAYQRQITSITFTPVRPTLMWAPERVGL